MIEIDPMKNLTPEDSFRLTLSEETFIGYPYWPVPFGRGLQVGLQPLRTISAYSETFRGQMTPGAFRPTISEETFNGYPYSASPFGKDFRVGLQPLRMSSAYSISRSHLQDKVGIGRASTPDFAPRRDF